MPFYQSIQDVLRHEPVARNSFNQGDTLQQTIIALANELVAMRKPGEYEPVIFCAECPRKDELLKSQTPSAL
jgi:hypothetical protein